MSRGTGGLRSRRGGRAAVVAAAGALLIGLVGCGVLPGTRQPPDTHHPPGADHTRATGSVGTLLDRTDDAGHRLRQVDAEKAPAIELSARPDSEDGWNLRLDVSSFRFTPDSVGGSALPRTGHAHLYLDGNKVARVYGEWFHLPAADVPDGPHDLTARLYADDHTAWAVDGEPVEASTTIDGAERATGHEHEHPGPGDGDSADGGNDDDPPEADRTVAISVTDGRVDPTPGRTEVEAGTTVAFTITSDRADEVHLHGYDRTVRLRPGEPGTLRVTADRTGRFELETHASGLLLTQLLVR